MFRQGPRRPRSGYSVHHEDREQGVPSELATAIVLAVSDLGGIVAAHLGDVMKTFKVLHSVAALGAVLSLGGQVHAQEQPYQGKVGRTLAESTEWWPEPV